MAASDEKRDYVEGKREAVDAINPSSSQQTIEVKEKVTDDVDQEDAISQISITPGSEGHETEDEEHEGTTNATPIRPQSSRTSSVFARTGAIVPRAQRRGLFARFAVIPEIERPHEYTTKTKWIITAIIALVAAAAPMGVGIFYRRC